MSENPLGFIGWGPQSQLVAHEMGERGVLVHPLGDANSSSHPTGSLEKLFGLCDILFMESGFSDLEKILPSIRLAISDRHLLVVLGEGVGAVSLQKALNDRKLVRVLLNPALSKGQSLMVFYPTVQVAKAEREKLKALFSHVPHVLEVDSEKRFKALVALSEFIPAALQTLFQAVGDGVLMTGLPPEETRVFLDVMLQKTLAEMDGEGSGKIRETALKHARASGGLVELETAGIRGGIMKALERVAREAKLIPAKNE